MKERPILFSSAMVRAILEGKKTQTRRVIKPQPLTTAEVRQRLELPSNPETDHLLCYETRSGRGLYGFEEDDFRETMARCYSPWKVGDRLWVREAFTPYRADHWIVHVDYAAGGSRVIGLEAWPKDPAWTRKSPSIHMPRWASRITLEITEVRVQRLQDIKPLDAKAEGIDPHCPAELDIDECLVLYLRRFAELWDSINGKKPGCSWDDNRWVWALSFRRMQ